MTQQTCEPQEIQWWSDRCATCDHLLATHRDAPTDDGELVNAECSLCVMQLTIEQAISQQNTALRAYAEELRDQAQAFATQLQDKAKEYIDAENTRFAGVAKDYVDALRADAGKAITDLGTKVDNNQASAKTYIDQQDTKYQAAAKSYVDTQIPLVITAKVQPSALK